MAPVGGKGRASAPQFVSDEAAEPQHVPLEDGPLLQRRAGNARLQGLPDLGLAHRVRIGLRIALEVHPLHGGAALADESEAARGVAVDQLFRAWWRFAQDAEPGERILAEVSAGRRSGDGGADQAAGAVTAHDEVGLNLQRRAVRVRREHAGSIGLDVFDTVDGDTEPKILPGSQAYRDQVDEHLVLREEPDTATRERGEVDPMPLALEPKLDAVVAVSDRLHARGGAGLVEELHGGVFQDAGADRLLDLLAGALIEHDRVDASGGKKV